MYAQVSFPGIIGRKWRLVCVEAQERPLLRLERYPDELFVSVCLQGPNVRLKERTVWFAHGGNCNIKRTAHASSHPPAQALVNIEMTGEEVHTSVYCIDCHSHLPSAVVNVKGP